MRHKLTNRHGSGDGGEIVLDLSGRQSLEAVSRRDADLDIVFRHLTFKALLQGQNGSVYSILQLKVIAVSETHSKQQLSTPSKRSVNVKSVEWLTLSGPRSKLDNYDKKKILTSFLKMFFH